MRKRQNATPFYWSAASDGYKGQVVERSRVNQLVSQMNEKEEQISEQGDAIAKMAELAKHVSLSFSVSLCLYFLFGLQYTQNTHFEAE